MHTMKNTRYLTETLSRPIQNLAKRPFMFVSLYKNKTSTNQLISIYGPSGGDKME